MKRKKKPPQAKRTCGVSFATVRKLALSLPHAAEGTSYGTPAFKVEGVLFARQHQDGESLVIKIDDRERSIRMQADPETFYITDHYLNYPMMLVRLSTVDVDELRELLEESWRRSAPANVLASTQIPED